MPVTMGLRLAFKLSLETDSLSLRQPSEAPPPSHSAPSVNLTRAPGPCPLQLGASGPPDGIRAGLLELQAHLLVERLVPLRPPLLQPHREEEVHFLPEKLAHLPPRPDAEVLDHADEDAALAFRLAEHSLFDANRAVWLLLERRGVHKRRVRHLLMRTKEDALAGDLGGDDAGGDVGELGRRVQPLPEGHAVFDVVTDGLEALATLGRHSEHALHHAPLPVHHGLPPELLSHGDEEGLALRVELVHLVQDQVELLPALRQPLHDEVLVGAVAEAKRERIHRVPDRHRRLPCTPPPASTRDDLVGVDDEEDLVRPARAVPR
mmetsp:Transcript_47937/g.113166  ORF Transcript_47937/g.113166 Transcript_47937/m.113166 type:complete len:320 (-) Transcript_47937:130-1089(-)